MIRVTIKYFNSEEIISELQMNRPFIDETIFIKATKFRVVDIVHAGKDLIAYVQEHVKQH